MKPVITWVMIADSKGAKFYENDGPGHGIKPVHGQDYKAPEKKEFDHDQGRTFDSSGPGRHKHQPHFSVDDRFAKLLADALDTASNAGQFDQLILCASPEVLGLLRKQLVKPVQDKVLTEIPKNLAKVPVTELGKHLESHLAV